MLRALLLLHIVAIAFITGQVTAQGPLDPPTSGLSLEGLPPAGASIVVNGTMPHTATARVTLTLSNILCPQANNGARVPVAIAITAGNGTGVRIEPANTTLTFNVGAGAYTSSTGPYSGTEDVSYTVFATGNGSSTLSGILFSATLAADPDSYGCAANSPGVPAASATRAYTVRFDVPQTPVVTPSPSPKMPALEPILFGVAVALVALVIRWRRH